MLGEKLLDAVEIAFGRQENAARAHDRLGDKGGNRLGPLARDQRLEIAYYAGGEGLLVFALLGETVEMRAGGMENPLDRKIESLVKGRDAGEASGGIGQAVIAAKPGYHLLLLRPAEQIVVIAHQLEIGVVGVRA